MITGETQFSAILHHPGEPVEVLSDDKTAFVMPFFWPGVGIKDKGAANGILWHGIEKGPGVIIADADVVQLFVANRSQQLGDPVDERFATDKPDTGMSFGLGGQMLAAAKADFKP